MGVVYKLKNEVVDFIINQKRLNPALGCRNLVNVVQGKFQIKLSKSSINAVIKDAELSSCVGRKSFLVKKSIKFKIPETTKNQLFTAELTQKEPARHSPPTKSIPPTELPDLKNNFPPKIQQPFQLKNNPPNGDVSTLKKPLVTVLPQEQLTDPSSPLIPSGELFFSEKNVCDCMGGFFLKAAFLNLSFRQALENILGKYIDSEFNKEMGALGEMMFYLPIFGLTTLEDLDSYQGKGFWMLSGLEQRVTSEKFIKFISSISDSRSFSLRWENEAAQIFSESACVKITLADFLELFFDAQFRVLSFSSKNTSSYLSPTSRIVGEVVSKIIANVHPVIFQKLDALADLKFLEILAAAFSGKQDQRIAQIEVIDEKGKNLSHFASIPLKKRHFIIGVNPLESNFLKTYFLEKESFKKTDALFKHSVEFRESLIGLGDDLNNSALRIFLVRSLEGKSEIMIISNINEELRSSEEIVLEYLNRWPYPFSVLPSRKLYNSLEDGHCFPNKFLEETMTVPISPKCGGEKSNDLLTSILSPDVWGKFISLFPAFHLYCQKQFFPDTYHGGDVSLMKERFYKLHGEVRRETGFCDVLLQISRNDMHINDLKFAVQKVNESYIKDLQGDTIRMSLKEL